MFRPVTPIANMKSSLFTSMYPGSNYLTISVEDEIASLFSNSIQALKNTLINRIIRAIETIPPANVL